MLIQDCCSTEWITTKSIKYMEEMHSRVLKGIEANGKRASEVLAKSLEKRLKPGSILFEKYIYFQL